MGHTNAMTGQPISPYQPRALDHCVLPVEALDAARVRLEALGFQVAADATHPFGTENACVFFADGTYLEPLGIAQREDCERTAERGNTFTARDQAYRFRNGEDGFSGVALATDNAGADQKRFRRQGISAGRTLRFGRTMRDGAGNSGRASFCNAFAADLRSPDSFLFCCQRVRMPDLDRSSLQAHPNTVSGIAGIVASEANPADFQYFLQEVLDNRATQAHSFGIEIAMANAGMNVMTPEGLAVHFGIARQVPTRGLRFEGIVLKVRDPDALGKVLGGNDVQAQRKGRYLVVDRAPGQGAFLAFDMEGTSR